MECRVVISSLSDYLDGSLVTQEIQSIETHLNHCAPCNSVKADLSQICLAAQELPLRTPSRALWVRIQNELEMEAAAPGKQPEKKANWWQRWSERRFTFTLPQLAGASALAFSLMVFGLYHTLHSDQPLGAKTATDVVLPMEKELQSKIQQKAINLSTRRQTWNPQIRAEYDNNLQKIDNELQRVRQTLVTTREPEQQTFDQQKVLLDLYNVKLQLMEDFERIEK